MDTEESTAPGYGGEKVATTRINDPKGSNWSISCFKLKGKAEGEGIANYEKAAPKGIQRQRASCNLSFTRNR